MEGLNNICLENCRSRPGNAPVCTSLEIPSENNSRLDIVESEEWAITNIKEKNCNFPKTRVTWTKNKNARERAGERWWWFVCLFFFFFKSCFPLSQGGKRSSLSLYARENAGTLDTFYRQLPFFPLFLSVVYFNICTIYREPNATPYRKAKGKKEETEKKTNGI